MRAPRRSGTLALFVVAALVAAVAATVGARGRAAVPVPAGSASWRSLVGEPRAAVASSQRMIVVLSAPSLAERLAKARFATEAQERGWTSQALAAQQEVLTTLAAEGVVIRRDFTYARVLDGFAATLDGRAVALLDQLPEVVGVYPVRAAYPASVSESTLATGEFGLSSGRRPDAGLPGSTGRGVTVALLDTGVDGAHPYLRGKVLPGFDIVGGTTDTDPRADPADKTQLERHGTELAGILVGSDGPNGLHGVAPDAQVLPIRVAGWQPAADGKSLVYSRSDQLIAGLERAVDPNGDGDAHDAVRVAVVGVAEPFASFADSPEARAVQGALDLSTVVVAPAGNDGVAGPMFGSVAGPAGAAGALAVGAVDSRADLPTVRVVLRRGLDVILDRRVPLLGPFEPTEARVLQVATARSQTSARSQASGASFFDAKGSSLVAGRAAVTPAGADPEATAEAAIHAGAAAVVLYGDDLPAGALRLSESQTAPVVVVPTPAAVELLAAQRAGFDVGVAVGAARNASNTALGGVAGFSSRGLAFDGSVKPDVVAPGVGIATSEPGTGADGGALYGTVNGTSGAAATVGGAAALLAQLRPSLDGAALESLLVGYAQQQGVAAATATGAGTLRLGASAVGEVAAQPSSLGFGIWQGPHWHATRTIVVRNVSSRRLQLSLSAVAGGDSEALHFTVKPSRLLLRVGRSASVRVTVRASAPPSSDVVTGAIQVAAAGSETLRVPWALSFHPPVANLLPHVSLNDTSFKPSDTTPALLTIQVGDVVRDGGLQIVPVSRLDLQLYSASGHYLGTLARLRDLLPGSYSFGITGRGPSSARLAPGAYQLRLAAWPALPLVARPSKAQVTFRIE
ncbi:MAG TPA: S8 family serine peptidase [Gaiellaceae bacterium]